MLEGFRMVWLPNHAYGLHLDSDAALALEIHAVEHLVAHQAVGNGPRALKLAVGEGGFTMVNMSDDGKIG